MPASHDPLKNAFDSLKEIETPSEQQKEKMLCGVLAQGRLYETSLKERICSFIADYPWRVAFGVSFTQAVVFTLVFGTRYTNTFLSFFGG